MMTETKERKIWTFIIPGKPMSKGRHRTWVTKPKQNENWNPKKHGRAFTYKDDDTVAYESLVKSRAFNAKVQMVTRARVSIVICFPCRVKEYKTKPNKLVEPMVRGDTDNILKIVMDGLKGIAYKDDKHVLESPPIFRFLAPDEQPCVIVTIEEVSWMEYLSDSAKEYLKIQVRRSANEHLSRKKQETEASGQTELPGIV